MKSPYRIQVSGRKFAAFTLLELLAAIGIVSLLAALLIGGSKEYIKKAGQVNCASNLRQIASCFASYSNDNDGYVVPYSYSADPVNYGGANAGWFTYLSSNYQLSYLKLRCPANNNGYLPPSPWANSVDIWYKGSPNYMYNTMSGADYAAPAPPAGGVKQRVKFSSIEAPSRKAMLMEGAAVTGWQKYRCNYAFSPVPSYFDKNSGNYCVEHPHGGVSNVLFWDGHVEGYTKGQITYDMVVLTN